MIGKTIHELRTGDAAEIVRRVDASDVAELVDAVGDHNPIHSDPEYAAATPFKEPIAPGVFTAGLISAVIGTRLPGPGAIYLSQSLEFTRPVKVGDTVTARVTVQEVVAERNRIRLSTVCSNQRGEDVLRGEAWVMPSRKSIVYERRDPAPAVPLALQPWAWTAQALAFWATLGVSMLDAATSTSRR